MRQLLTILLVLAFAGSALAISPDAIQKVPAKGTHHVMANPTYDREGGEDMATAVPFTALPFYDTGATCDNLDDWDEVCPYDNSTSPDVWYSFAPDVDIFVNVDLEGSAYDTKTYILDANYNVIGCNDDFYSDWTSLIEGVQLMAGVTYYIVVDGYGGDCGDYTLNVYEYFPPEPCYVECSGEEEGEPDNSSTYEDFYNGGCNTDGVTPLDYIQILEGDQNGNLTFCGVGGWTGAGKDTDWFSVTYGASGQIEWTVESEIAAWFFEIEGQVCDGELINIMTPGECEVTTVTMVGTPGSQAWIWAGAQEYSPPVGFDGYNFNYRMEFTGLQEGPVATEATTFDSLKSLYR